MEYQEFRAMYEEQHPASVPVETEPVAEYPWWLQYAVLVMFICSALLSGVHTIPTAYDAIPVTPIISEFIRTVIANLSFLAVELAIMICAYSLSRKFNLTMFITLCAVILIAMAANVDSVLTALAAQDDGKRIVAVILGVGAPLIAFTSGEMFVRLYRSSVAATMRAQEQFRADQKQWDEIVFMAFTDHEEKLKNEEKIRLDEERKLEEKRKRDERRQSKSSTVQPSNGQSNGQTSSPAASTRGHNKVPNASELARQHFTEHPEDLDVQPRQLEDVIGVGKSTINNVQREMKARLSSNGHSNGHVNGNHGGNE